VQPDERLAAVCRAAETLISRDGCLIALCVVTWYGVTIHRVLIGNRIYGHLTDNSWLHFANDSRTQTGVLSHCLHCAAWWRFPTADVFLPPSSETVPGSATSFCNSQLPVCLQTLSRLSKTGGPPYILSRCGVCDYRRCMDWWMDLLTTRTTLYRSLTHKDSCPQPMKLSTRHSCKRFNTVEIPQLPALRSSCLSGQWIILINWQLKQLGSRLAAISRSAPSLLFIGWLPTELSHHPATSRDFAQLNCWQHQPTINSLSKSKSKSELLYVWRFAASQFVLASSPLRSTSRDFFQLNPCGNSPYVTSSLTRRWVCLLRISWSFIKCTYRTYGMLQKIFPFALYTSPLSVQALQSRSCLSYLSNGSLVTWLIGCFRLFCL
jgi:hypothetical protein